MPTYRHTITSIETNEVIQVYESEEALIEAPQGTSVTTADITQEVLDRRAEREQLLEEHNQLMTEKKEAYNSAWERLKMADTSQESSLVQDIVTVLKWMSNG